MSFVGPSEYPELSEEFQTRIEISSAYDGRSFEALLFYNRFNKNAQLTIQEKKSAFIQRFKYKTDELFLIRGKSSYRTNLTWGVL